MVSLPHPICVNVNLNSFRNSKKSSCSKPLSKLGLVVFIEIVFGDSDGPDLMQRARYRTIRPFKQLSTPTVDNYDR